MNVIIKFQIFKLVYVLDFTSSKQFFILFLFFFLELNMQGYIRSKAGEHYHHVISLIQICLGTQFHFKQKILIFWVTFSQKGYLRSKIEKN